MFGKLEDADSLMRPPQGYDESNPAIEYLKMRNYITGIPFTDADLTSRNLLKKIVSTFTTMKPFIDFLGRALE